VIHAAQQAGNDPVDRIGHAAALQEYAEWALVHVPSRGVLSPAEDRAYQIIQGIATRHLRYQQASRAFTVALASVKDISLASALESAENERRSISDDAYYYAGLACGLTLAAFARGE
jgi:hypothetical protein